MAIYPFTGTNGNGTTDELLGDAFRVVKDVRDNLAAINEVALRSTDIDTLLAGIATIQNSNPDGNLRVPSGETVSPLPNAATRSSKFLGFDGVGNVLLSTASSLAAAIAPYMPEGLKGIKGDPGDSTMSIGLFTSLSGITIPASVKVVQTTGHGVLGRGIGRYIHDTAVDAAFVAANPLWSFLAADGRGFRLDASNGIWFNQFGADPVNRSTGTTAEKTAAAEANYNAWQAMRQCALYNKVDAATVNMTGGYQWMIGGFPQENIDAGMFWFGNKTISLAEGQHRIIGQGSGDTLVRGSATKFMWDGTCDGLVIHDAKGTPPVSGNIGYQGFASNCIIEGIAFDGGGGPIFRKDTLANPWCGIWSRAGGTIIRYCGFVNWACAGTVVGFKPGLPDANSANHVFIKQCNYLYTGYAGAYWDGGDSNAGSSEGCSFIHTGYFGLYDSSFLANGHRDHHVRGVGAALAGTKTEKCKNVRTSVVYHNLWYWYCCFGKEAQASVTEPGTNETIWAPMIGPYQSPHPELGDKTWTSGMAVHECGSYVVDGLNSPTLLLNCYMEGDSPGVYLASLAMAMGGLSGPQPASNGSFLAVKNGAFSSVTSGMGVSYTYYDPAYQGGTAVSERMQINIGGNKGNRDILYMENGAQWPQSSRIRLSTDYKDLVVFDYANSESNVGLIYTGPNTTRSYGSGTPRPHHIHIPRFIFGTGGSGGAGRRMDTMSAAPTTGTWARGDIVYNSAPSAGGKVGWICVTGGAPGTWKAFGAIDA